MPGIGITALLPIRNGEKYLPYLKEKLAAICATADEILVISDGSTDKTNLLISEWARLDSRVNPIICRSQGLVRTLNLGISEASHNWIARFDADDTYDLNRLNLQRKLISEDVSAIFSDYEFQTDSHYKLGLVPSGITPTAVFASLSSGNRTAHPSVVFNKDKAVACGGYVQDDFRAEDLSLWIRMSALGNLISVPLNLLQYTLTKNSITRSSLRGSRQAKEKVLRNYFDRVNLQDFTDNFLMTKQAYTDTRLGDLRLLLHLRDISRIASEQGSEEQVSKLIWSETRQLISKVGVDFSIGRLVVEKILRKIYLAT
ncbi:glyco_like_mftF, transferase 2, rSAM/selenodomain-associated [Candidatus Nanopelagicaceae bacterium]